MISAITVGKLGIGELQSGRTSARLATGGTSATVAETRVISKRNARLASQSHVPPAGRPRGPAQSRRMAIAHGIHLGRRGGIVQSLLLSTHRGHLRSPMISRGYIEI